jgi:hypothetical protein
MGLFSAIRKMFTSPYFLKPSEWLQAIPLLQSAFRESLPLHLATLDHCSNLFEALEALLLVEVELENEAQISREMGEEGLPYPINISRNQFALICDLLYLQPLSEEELRQVVAGPGARERMGL